jgi:uncharacterized protein YdaU (DUF1376 family)
MSKQPYIPLYIGDWTQDTDALSIEAEGAWLRIIFKCWRNEGSFTATPEILARVCKMSVEKFATVLLEWEICNTCTIERHEAGLITLKSRRITEDVKISKIRKQIGSKGGSKTQANRVANTEQKPEYDIDNVIDTVVGIKEEVQEKPLTEIDTANILLDQSLDEGYLDQEQMKWPHLDFPFELETFRNKVRGSPGDYSTRDVGGIRLAFQYQLRNSKGKPKNGTSKDKSTEHVTGLMEGIKQRYGGASSQPKV